MPSCIYLPCRSLSLYRDYIGPVNSQSWDYLEESLVRVMSCCCSTVWVQIGNDRMARERNIQLEQGARRT